MNANKKESKMNNSKRQLIEKALELTYRAQELVDEAVKGTSAEAHYEAYGKYGFNQLQGNGNPYDKGLEDLLADCGDDGPFNPENANGTCCECGTKENVADGCMLCDDCLGEYEDDGRI